MISAQRLLHNAPGQYLSYSYKEVASSCLAIRYAYSAVLKFPTCILPVGLVHILFHFHFHPLILVFLLFLCQDRLVLMVRLILPILSTSATLTVTSSPMFYNIFYLCNTLVRQFGNVPYRLLFGANCTNAPKFIIRTTLPVNTIPASISVTIPVTIAIARSIIASSVPQTLQYLHH